MRVQPSKTYSANAAKMRNAPDYLFGGAALVSLTVMNPPIFYGTGLEILTRAERELPKPLITDTRINTASGDLAYQRNLSAEWFLDKTEAEWFLGIDTDATFHPQQVVDLIGYADALKDEGFGIVTGITATGGYDDGPTQSNWFVRDEIGGLVRVTRIPTGESGNPAPMELVACGHHFLAVHRRVFHKIRERNPDKTWPWYDSYEYRTPLGNSAWIGEDVSLCLRAAQVDERIAGIPSLDVGHAKTQVWHAKDVPDLFEKPYDFYNEGTP